MLMFPLSWYLGLLPFLPCLIVMRYTGWHYQGNYLIPWILVGKIASNTAQADR